VAALFTAHCTCAELRTLTANTATHLPIHMLAYARTHACAHIHTLQGYLDARVEAKYEEIIAHLQRALNSSEEDEGDFKKHAKTLQDLVEQLSASKADRRELLELKQFVVSLNDSHGGGSRRRSSSGDASLTGSITRDEVFNLLEEKIGRRDLERRLALLNTRLNALTRGVGELFFMY
jgi:molybdopterin converting factor small subunit